MATGKEGGNGKKRGRTPEEPGKGKETAKASHDDDRCAICLENVSGDLGVLPCVSDQGYVRYGGTLGLSL